MMSKSTPSSCRNGMTSAMLTSNGTPVYVTPTIIAHTPSEGAAASLAALASSTASNAIIWAFKLQRSSHAQMIAERRLCLGISEAGTIVWAADGTPDSLFGVAPGALIGQSLAAWIDIFADYTASGG
jgi:hypothetical protein